MANADTYIGINKGSPGISASTTDIVIGTSTGSTDFEFRMNALDVNSNKITRMDALLALEAIERVLESNDIFTTEMAD